MLKEAIAKLMEHKDLTQEEAGACMDEIMSGNANEILTSSFLTALAAKGETIDEITACARVMREHALKVDTDMNLLEIVGTGGDGAQSFNISTTASFVLAAGGVKVAKHGNRAASSKSGAADCLEALGINIEQSPEKCVELLEKTGICFFFAQKYHSSMKYVGPVRKELGIRTVFNVLGPLTNPVLPKHQILGVYSEEIMDLMAKVLVNLGINRGMVVYGTDKLDEISISAPTKICEIENGALKQYTITPEDFGLPTADKEEIVGGTPEENAQITLRILKGEEQGAKRNIVLLNAAAGLYIDGKADSLADGVKLAAELIDTKAALAKLNEYAEAAKA